MADGQFGAFLRSRRDRAVTAPPTGRRRVPGLRREELAAQAGVSVDYVVRLEQGRVLPSVEVAAALARALRLDAAEREHLLSLARPASPDRLPDERVRPGIRTLLDRLEAQPAYVTGPWLDVLAWNTAGAALLLDIDRRPQDERNLARLVFLDEAYGRLLGRDGPAAASIAGSLRLAQTRFGDHPVVAELLERSPAFARLWAQQDVFDKPHGPKTFDHPRAGRLVLEVESLAVGGSPGQTLVVYHGQPVLRRAAAMPAIERASGARSASRSGSGVAGSR
jgi:transcriptional regulator with XRE-family HTH domain